MDLVVLIPDQGIRSSIQKILERHHSIGIGPLSFQTFVHVARDPGCFLESHDFLRIYTRQSRHALVLFDRDGCGQEHRARNELEADVDQRLAASGWDDRAATIVLDPELEAWVWSESPHVERVLGWEDRVPDLRSWLREKGYLQGTNTKPNQPKEAYESALRTVGRHPSAALFAELAQVVGFERCSDPAFIKLLTTLRRWFQPKE